MSIRKLECITVACDDCGEEATDGDTIIHFDAKTKGKDLRQQLQDWGFLPYGAGYLCGGCYDTRQLTRPDLPHNWPNHVRGASS